jgi:hypothetical protein
MDKELIQKLEAMRKSGSFSAKRDYPVEIYVDAAHPFLHVVAGDSHFEHCMKPIRDLFCPEDQLKSEEDQQRLLLAIESPIADRYDEHPEHTDSNVLIALDLLIQSPDAAIDDPLCLAIQKSYWLFLSINETSRSDLRKALRRVRKSVERHKKANGIRGYLDFISQFL